MPLFIAAATNEIASGSPAEKISVVLNGAAVGWGLGLTFVWDVVDLWVRARHFKFLRTQAFWI